MIAYFSRIRKLVIYWWNPGFARMKFLAMLVYAESVSFAGYLFGRFAGFNEGILGGPVSWVASSLYLFIFIYSMVSFTREGLHATKLLKAKELPCTKCGYPLLEDESLPCPECGVFLERKKIVQYWKDRWLVESYYFYEME